MASSRDEQAALQILGVFAERNVPANGILIRNYFFQVRDSDFLCGIDRAVAHGWIVRHERDRYCYVLTGAGRDVVEDMRDPATTAD
jgi:hypothetical protein